MRPLKKYLLIAGAAFIGIQFLRPARNLDAHAADADPLAGINIPAELKSTLRTSCFDCHSDHTHYPWYASVQPIGWWINTHVRTGKRHLNFSRFPEYSPARAGRKLEAISYALFEHRMPLPSYLRTHADARLTDEQIAQLVDWAGRTGEELQKQESDAPPPPAH
jgi:hypothetical protein